jgi:PTH1 family peptidyl-tRNA hydrolase
MTFMNRIGHQRLGEAVRFYKVPLDKVVVFHDELDIAARKVRVKVGGGAGRPQRHALARQPHVGKDYRRVRMGIGHPGRKDRVLSYVLRGFPQPDERG